MADDEATMEASIHLDLMVAGTSVGEQIDAEHHIKNARIPNLRAVTHVQRCYYVTQRLGIQYLWIDSQCILQDHREDWEKESANMFSIYEGAFITIATTSAPNDKAGCLVTRRR